MTAGGGSRSDPQCALLPSSSRITACKPEDYRRQCRLDSPCLCGSAHSHVPAPGGLTQPGESIVSSPLHTSAPGLGSCFSHLLSLTRSHFSSFFSVWSFDHRRLLWCLLVITWCWWSRQKNTLVCATGAVSALLKVKQRCESAKCFYKKKKLRVLLIPSQLWNSDMRSVICQKDS